MEYVIVKARQRGNYAANSPSPDCVISSISSSTSIQLFSEEGIIHRLGEGFYHIKSDIPREYFINFKARQSMGVNVLGGIYG